MLVAPVPVVAMTAFHTVAVAVVAVAFVDRVAVPFAVPMVDNCQIGRAHV